MATTDTITNRKRNNKANHSPANKHKYKFYHTNKKNKKNKQNNRTSRRASMFSVYLKLFRKKTAQLAHAILDEKDLFMEVFPSMEKIEQEYQKLFGESGFQDEFIYSTG